MICLLKLWIELLDVLSKWLWPVTIFLIVLLFRVDISRLLGRIKKGSLFGNEFELEPAIDQLRQEVEKAKQEVLADSVTNQKLAKQVDILDDEIEQIIVVANNSPELALMKLSALLEKETRILLGSLGALDRGIIGINQMFNILSAKGYLSKHMIEALKTFSQVRNLIVHGRKPEDDRIILKVLDIGTDLLKTINSIPHEIYIVYETSIDLYKDKDCQSMRDGVKGLILETSSSDKTQSYKRIFPTTNPLYYKQGTRVTWEWNMNRVWDITWYIDRSTGEKKLAWNQSSEFVGRDINNI